MSYTTIWKVYKTRATHYTEFQNAWGSAPVVWDWLSENILKENFRLYSKNKALWQLYKNPNVPECMRFGLLATFDNATVPLDKLSIAAEVAMNIYKATNILNPNRINHWRDISCAYDKLSESKDTRLVGIALGCTSVSDPWEFDFHLRKPFDIFSVLKDPSLLTLRNL